MKNRIPPWAQTCNYKRRVGVIAPTASFLIFTEGKTEELYFNDFRLGNAQVRAIGLGRGSTTLVSDAIKKKKLYAKNGEVYTQYWIVFDRDSGNNTVDQIYQAIAQAEKNGFRWAFSNPCFEIWYLLHFVLRNTSTTADELKNSLIPHYIPGYKETMKGIYQQIKGRQGNAVNNAGQLIVSRLEWQKNLANVNPSTNIFDLVGELNKS